MNTTSTQTLDLGNNETIRRGLVRLAGGGFLALTYGQSKTYKSEAAAIKWLARRNVNPDGTRIP